MRAELQATSGELSALRLQHDALLAKHEQRERDFDLLLQEQRDTAAQLSSIAAELALARQQAERDQEGIDSLADEVRMARACVHCSACGWGVGRCTAM